MVTMERTMRDRSMPILILSDVFIDVPGGFSLEKIDDKCQSKIIALTSCTVSAAIIQHCLNLASSACILCFSVDCRGQAGSTKAIVDIDHAQSWCTTVEHAEQGGNPAKTCSVAN